MNLVSRLLPLEHVVLGLDAGSKKRLFEQIGLLFENTRQVPRAPVTYVEAPWQEELWRQLEAGLIQRARLLTAIVVVLALPWFVYPPIAMDIVCWALFARKTPPGQPGWRERGSVWAFPESARWFSSRS